MSVKQLVPLSNYSSDTAPSVPTLRVGDLYYNTSTGLMVYNGSTWDTVGTSSVVTNVDGGVFDGIAPYNGGDPTTTSTQSINGGTP